MEASASASLQQPQTQRGNGSRSNRYRRPRRGRGDSSNRALEFRPASIAPAVESRSQYLENPQTTLSRDDQGRQNTNKRGRPRGTRSSQSRTVNGRQFGGELTQQDEDESRQVNSATQLQANAAVFVPGQQPTSSTPAKPPAKHNRPRLPRQRPEKSEAPDIATRTHEDIDNGHYECPICTSEVRRHSKVWSCHDCWTVFHITCIKKWSANQGSAAAQQPNGDGELPPPRQWRCPGCNLPQDELPKAYTCWCSKEIDPRSVTGLPPHSCGNSCGRERARKCPHPCQLTCHAGPCPPCTHMGPKLECFCGKHSVTKRCSETDYANGWSCAEMCGQLMGCEEHRCSRPCHEGSCGECEVRIPAKCYCGQTEKDILCQDREEPKLSQRLHDPVEGQDFTEQWTGTFGCGNVCERPFDCGIHVCEKICHVQEAQPTHCPRSPDLITRCPCGKTPLIQLSDKPRNTCTDDIPHCKQVCEKILPCGHQDEQLCHGGDCSSCMKMVDIKCRCGRTVSRTICHQGTEEPPMCTRICRTTLNCGRHACDERCCSGERKATERQSSKRKQRPLGSTARPIDDGFEAEHICTRQCGRLLKCGTHFCTELCHKGPCGTCREAIFEEISCRCGRTILQPPLPCGTSSPPCRYPCDRPKACGHPQVAHNCHQDNEACPKCPFLMEKRCMCTKKTLKNQQCWLQDVRCGEICGKKLKCGSHFCRKLCHRPGECEDANGQECVQICGKEKKTCGHPDVENKCHAPFACKEDKPCQSKIYVTCPCQAQKQEMRCGASKTSEGNNGKTLSCNEECARLERNRKLALALNIDQSTHIEGGDHIPYSADTLSLFVESVKWAQTQEREFRVFASSDDERRMRFKPMQPQQRAFIHALAEDFGLDSESMDPEPHRHVMIWKTPRFVSAPNKTLAEALRVRQAQRSATGSANVSDNEAPKKSKRSNLAGEPFNAFLISRPRFGLTIDELRSAVAEVVPPTTTIVLDIEFLPSDEIVMKAVNHSASSHEMQQMLQNIRFPLATAIVSKGYGSVQLCTADSSLNIIRRETDSLGGGDGWSKVAAKKAAPKISLSSESFAATNAFAALSNNKVTFAKKKPEKIKPKKEVVVDDWEVAELAEEEKERATSGASGDESEGHLPPAADELPEKINVAAEQVSDAIAEGSGTRSETLEASPADKGEGSVAES